MEKVSICKGSSYSTNFIDKNNVFVGFDDRRCVSEDFGYVIYKNLKDEKQIFVGDISGYLFDTKYFNDEINLDELSKLTDIEYWDIVEVAEFRLTKEGEDDIYLVLYNSHNGYYGHGFEFVVDGKVIEEGSL